MDMSDDKKLSGVEQNFRDQLNSLLVKSCKLSGLNFQISNEEVLERVSKYFQLLNTWGKTVDLVSPAPEQMILSRHFVDSLLTGQIIKEKLQISNNFSYLDIGSGAGFPGMVLGILEPERKICLVEPRRKRSNFLREVSRKLSLKNILVSESRIEELKLDDPELSKLSSPALLITRATGFTDLFLKEASRLLVDQGFAIEMSSGASQKHEAICQMSLFSRIPYSLAPDNAQRSLIVWQKCFT
jgi:16S rRNA (guanine(527)-N(7))-methyltransferase RsmG